MALAPGMLSKSVIFPPRHKAMEQSGLPIGVEAHQLAPAINPAGFGEDGVLDLNGREGIGQDCRRG